MYRLFWLLFFIGCAENPCIPLAEQACLMAKEKARRPQGQLQEVEKACETTLAAAKAADETMQQRCLADTSEYRKPPTGPRMPSTKKIQGAP
jgi:hypothetical protein